MFHQQRLRSPFLSLASCIILLFVSCQSAVDDESDTKGSHTITFSVTNYRQVSFDDLSASGTSRSDDESVVMSLANLSLTVFDAETGKVVTPTILHRSADFEQSAEAARTFPQFSVSLPNGRYRLLVLGYNGSHDCNIASPNHISWAGGYVPNTFLFCEDFTLNATTNLNKEITLRHVVAALRLTADDAIPADLAKVRFSSTAGGTVLDATTGFVAQTTGRTSDIEVPSGYAGKEGVPFTVYLFLPQDETTSDYVVQALRKDNAVLSVRNFTSVPLRINYLTLWQGKLFDASGSDETTDWQGNFAITWSMDWAGTLKVE